MYYLAIELFAADILQENIYEENDYARFLRGLNCRLALSPFVPQGVIGDTALYRADILGTARMLLPYVVDIQRYLHSESNFLHGFALYLDKRNPDSFAHDDHLLSEITSALRESLESNCLIVGAGTWREVNRYLRAKKSKFGYVVSTMPRTRQLPDFDYVEATSIPRCVEFVQSWAAGTRQKTTAKVDGLYNPHLIVLHGEQYRSAHSSIVTALRSIGGESGGGDTRSSARAGILPLVIGSTGTNEPSAVEFAHSLVRKDVQRYLGALPEKQRVWALHLFNYCAGMLVDSSVAAHDVHLHTCFLQLFKSIVEGLRRLSESSKLPAVIVVDDGSNITKEQWEYLWDTCKSENAQSAPRIIFSCNAVPEYIQELPNEIYKAGYTFPDVLRKKIEGSLEKSESADNILDEFFGWNYGPNGILYHALLASYLQRKSVRAGAATSGTFSKHSNVIVHYLPHSERIFASLMALFAPYYSLRVYWDFLASIHYPRRQAEAHLHALITLGVVKDSSRCDFVHKSVEQALRRFVAANSPHLARAVAYYCYRCWRGQAEEGDLPSLSLSFALLSILAQAHLQEEALEVYFELVYRNALLGDSKNLEILLRVSRDTLQPWIQDLDAIAKLQIVLAYARLHIALFKNDHKYINDLISAAHNNERETVSIYSGYHLLAQARYRYYTGDPEAALNCTTKAIIVFQEHGDNLAIERAYTDCASYQLSIGRMSEAANHMRIACDIPGDTGRDVIRTLGIDIILQFGMGNFSAAPDLYPRIAEESRTDPWTLYARFIKARSRFELGDYSMARKEFKKGLMYAQMMDNTSATEVYSAWIARSDVYTRNFQAAISRLEQLTATREILCFLAEAYTLRGDYDHALSYLRNARSMRAPQRTAIFERPDWRDGFIGCGSSYGTVLDRMIRALEGYLLDKHGHRREAEAILNSLINIENLSPYDPYVPIYYILYSEILDQENLEQQKLRQLLIGRALKCMQERSQRISHTEDRFHYVKQNFWNKRLLGSAQEYHLL